MTERPVDIRRQLTFSTLGPLQVARGQDTVPLGGRQQRAVLAALIVHQPAVLSVARIADELWGDWVPAGHVRTIHTYIHHLRAALEPDPPGGEWQVLRTVNGGYRLVVDKDTIDAVAFEQLAGSGQALLRAGDAALAREEFGQALALWRDDNALADLADFRFVLAYGSRLEELRLTAIEGQIDARLALGEHESVVAELDHLTGRYPLRERIHAQRMLALYRSGRQAEALAAYRTMRHTLDHELGVQPSAPLKELHEAILAQDPAIAAPSIATLAAPSRGLPGRPRPRRRTVAVLAVAVLAAGIAAAAYRTREGRQHSLSALPANSIGVLASDGTLHDAVIVGPNPSAATYGGGTVWVTSSTDGRVTRLDPRTHRVAETIPVGRSPDAITLTAHDAWVVNTGDATVSRINTDTNTVVQTIAVGSLPTAIAAGPSGVWVANSGDDTIQRIDPATGIVDRKIDVGGRPDGIAVGEHAVWVANSADGSVTEIDPRNGQDISGPIAVGSGPGAIAMAGEALWVTDTDDQSVDRIDARTQTVVARVVVGDGPSSITLADRRLWVGNAYDGTVTEIDATTNAVRHRYAVGAAPRAVVRVGSSVWVAAGALAVTAHMGGTLTVADPLVPGRAVGIDPANEYLQSTTLRALRLVYDGLVSYHVTGGSAGLIIVPDLATTVPRPSDGGRTYAFTLRRGVRYSDGTPVRASDIKRGVLRSLTVATFPGGWATTVGIVGAQHCDQTHPDCDLSRGVVVDDATGSVVFHLDAPDPDFLFKLAYFGQATVPGAPGRATKTPLPGTGPYQIFRYHQGDTFELSRNPYFKQWSFAAQPAGYPDNIRWVKTRTSATAISDVLSGRADLVRLHDSGTDAVSRAETDLIQRQHPGQFHVENPFGLAWHYLNTGMPPLNDVRVRRAINYAVDRQKIVDVNGGPSRATPTCQLFPPDFPGYRPYCPYSTGTPNAAYDGPDLARARILVARSRTRGMSIAVTGPNDPLSHATNVYLVRVLRSLGYVPRLDELTADRYFTMLHARHARWQILQAPGWFADYPAASDFYLPLFSCLAEAPGTGILATPNCNRGLDALADKAYHAEGTDPAAARATWGAIDQALTDDADFIAEANELEATVVSQRVGNYQSSPELGPLLSQIWVR